MKKLLRFQVWPELSKSSISLTVVPQDGNLVQDEEEQEEETRFEPKKRQILMEHEWSIHLPSPLCTSIKIARPKRRSIPVPMKNVDVVRQTRKNTDNASVHKLNECWIDLKNGVARHDSNSGGPSSQKDTKG